VIGREFRQVQIECLDQFDHGRLDVALKNGFARLEPFAPIVALDGAQKRDALEWEA